MRGYEFTLSCPICAGPVDPRAEGATSGWQTRATAVCTGCYAELVVRVDVVVDRNERRATPAKRAQLARAREQHHRGTVRDASTRSVERPPLSHRRTP